MTPVDSTVNIGNITASGNISVTAGSTSQATTNLKLVGDLTASGIVNLQANGSILNSAGADITANEAVLQTDASIGADVMPFQLTVGQLAASAPGGIYISNMGPLVIGVVAPLAGLNSAGPIALTNADGPLTVEQNVAAGGNINFVTQDESGLGSDYFVLTNEAAIGTSAGSVILANDDSTFIQPGTAISSIGTVSIYSDFSSTNPSGTTESIEGGISAKLLMLFDGNDPDTIVLNRPTSDSTPTTIWTGTNPSDSLQVIVFTGSLEVNHTSGYGTEGVIPSLASSASLATFGMTVTFTATLPAAATGTVEFLNNGVSIGSGDLINGTASLVTNLLPVGYQSITAVYGGDNNFLAGSSEPVSLSVLPADSDVDLTSPGPSPFGAPVTFTASVDPLATGTVTFYVDGTDLGSGTLSGGIATVSTGTLAVGSHIVTAAYSGDLNFNSAASQLLTQIISQASTTVTISSTIDPSISGEQFALSAAVNSTNNSGVSAPTGAVTFMEGDTVLQSLAGLAPGQYTFTASYAGDSNYLPSISAPFVQTINEAVTTVYISHLGGGPSGDCGHRSGPYQWQLRRNRLQRIRDGRCRIGRFEFGGDCQPRQL